MPVPARVRTMAFSLSSLQAALRRGELLWGEEILWPHSSSDVHVVLDIDYDILILLSMAKSQVRTLPRSIEV
jgi:hypothetical protein